MAGSLFRVPIFRFTVQMCRNISFCYYFPPLLCYELTFLFYCLLFSLFVFIFDAMFFLSTLDLQLQIKFIYSLFLIWSPTVEVLQPATSLEINPKNLQCLLLYLVIYGFNYIYASLWFCSHFNNFTKVIILSQTFIFAFSLEKCCQIRSYSFDLLGIGSTGMQQ